ncbi:hypothetical protein VTH82DRAFT_3776 [Thermothelomyces myriococcoides]
MSGRRPAGLSRRQQVPHLLSSFYNKESVSKALKDVDPDGPPLSSSDSSDNEGLSTRGDIQPAQFGGTRRSKSPLRGVKDSGANGNGIAAGERLKRTRASTRLGSAEEPDTSTQQRVDEQQQEEAEAGAVGNDDVPGTPVSKRPKRSPPPPPPPPPPPGDGELDNGLDSDLFNKRATPSKRYGKKSRIFGAKQPRRAASPTKKVKPPPEDSASEAEDVERYKLKLPSSPPEAGSETPSPVCKFKPIPNLASPETPSPKRKKTLKMPDDDLSRLYEDHGAEASQRPAFTIPDEIPESFVGDDYNNEKVDLAFSQTTTNGAPSVSNLIRDDNDDGSTTLPLTDGDNDVLPSPVPACPLCKAEVPRAVLDGFKAAHPRMTVSDMRRFCEQHKRRSARETWVARGYPDIDWQRLDGRMAAHHAALRRILEGGAPSHYGALFRDAVRSGRNRTLLRSDANLTPGYYGLRGLRAMTENLIGEFSALLRRRAVEDRLVSARGYTAYLQAVLVPELAVRLIMEDLGVDEEEARKVLAESSAVGELLNDEIADVVLEDDEDDDDDDDDDVVVDNDKDAKDHDNDDNNHHEE